MTCDMWHVTRDRWQVTRDTWHVTHDMWHMTHGVVWTFSQNFSCLALTVWDLWCCEYLEEKADTLNQWINESMNGEAVCRTAPATPGLLIISNDCYYASIMSLTIIRPCVAVDIVVNTPTFHSPAISGILQSPGSSSRSCSRSQGQGVL